MKKFLGVLATCLAFVLTLTGCSCSKENDNKVALLYGDEDATSYRVIEYETLTSKITRQDTFLLYYFDSTCGGCKAFKPYLEEVISEKKLLVYAIDSTTLDKNNELKKNSYSTPTLILYSNGEKKQVFQSTDNKYADYFTSKEGFEKFLADNTYLPTMYLISKDTLASMVTSNKKFIVYFGNSSCSDCKSIDTKFFNNWLKNHTNTKKMYIVDRSDNDWEDGEWVEFKNTYGLSKTGSEEFGYGEGYTPTFQYREGNEIKDAVVIYNTYDYTTKTTITPYFSDDVSEGTAYTSIDDYRNDRTSFYASKLESFLNTNLTKVD